MNITPVIVVSRSHHSVVVLKDQLKLHFYKAQRNGLFGWTYMEMVTLQGGHSDLARDKITCAFLNNDQLYLFLKGENISRFLIFEFQLHYDRQTFQNLTTLPFIYELDMQHLKLHQKLCGQLRISNNNNNTIIRSLISQDEMLEINIPQIKSN